MRTLMISAALAASAVAAVPAAAQHHRGGPGWNQPRPGPGYNRPAPRNAERQIHQSLNRAEERIQRAASRRNLHPREATQFRREATQIRQQLSRYSRGGLSQGQFAELRRSVDHLDQRVRHAERRR